MDAQHLMTQNIYERAQSRLSKLSPEKELIITLTGTSVAVCGITIGGIYGLAALFNAYISHRDEIIKATEYIANHPYISAAYAASIAALGIGTYKYIERKLHVAKTLDDFVEKAKKSEKQVDIQVQWGSGLESYDEKIMLRSGKTRYQHICCQCDVFGSHLTRGKALGILNLLETTVIVAENLENSGLVVRVNGGTIDDTKKYLITCKEWVEKGYAFIAG